MYRALFIATVFASGVGCQLPPDEIAPIAGRDTDAEGPMRPGGAASDADGGIDSSSAKNETPGADAGAASPFTIIVLPDTQFYSQAWASIFDGQAEWIVANKEAQQIAFVLHTGDIVDSDVAEQWSVAAHSLAMLDGNVPYVVAGGNHDYSNIADRVGMTSQYLPVSRFAQNAYFGATFEPDHIENSYSVIPAGGASWLVLALEFGPRDEVLGWADATLRRFSSLPAIIITHAYLYSDGRRYDRCGPNQPWNPHDYVMMGQPGTSINDGEEVWRKLVLPNSNVKFVFSGHAVGDGSGALGYAAARLTSLRPDGSKVHQILANYQYCLGGPCPEVHGGNGFLRLVHIAPAERSVTVKTYSPYLDRFQTDRENEFALDLP